MQEPPPKDVKEAWQFPQHTQGTPQDSLWLRRRRDRLCRYEEFGSGVPGGAAELGRAGGRENREGGVGFFFFRELASGAGAGGGRGGALRGSFLAISM